MAKIFRDTLTLRERVLESGEAGSLLEMDLGLQLQMDPCPVTGTGDWNCLMPTIMGTETPASGTLSHQPQINLPFKMVFGSPKRTGGMLSSYKTSCMKYFVPASMNVCLINVCMCGKTWPEFCIHYNPLSRLWGVAKKHSPQREPKR